MSSNLKQDYVFNQSNGDVTQPVNTSYIEAYALYLGITEPLNNSWIQAICNHFGITEPLYGSWLIALANYYGITEPVNGSWWYALSQATPIPTDLIWNLVNTEWQDETSEWATATAPNDPIVSNQTFTDNTTPTIIGEADPNINITITIDGNSYEGAANASGDWAIQVTNPLSGATTPGTDYPLTAVAFDNTTGLESGTTNATITVILNELTITVQMFDSYGDGWNGGRIKVQQEVSPGVWEDKAYDGNPYYYINNTYFQSDLPENRVYYKTTYDEFSLTFTAYEYGVSTGGIPPYPSGAVWKDTLDIRTIALDPGFNYRTVSVDPGSYAAERSYDIKNGATVIASQPRAGSTEWQAGYVQTTFTL